jgi:hypothetical protein
MAASFSSNSTAAQELAAAAGMSIGSILAPSSSELDTGDAAGMDPGGLNPLLTGAGRGRHVAAAAAAAVAPAAGVEADSQADSGVGVDGNAAAAAAASDAVSSCLPDPAEAARRILQELGKCQLCGLPLLLLCCCLLGWSGQHSRLAPMSACTYK